MSYLAKRFEAAVLVLVGDGPVKQRLGQAYGRHLDDLQHMDMPDSLKDGYAELHAAMHAQPAVGKQSCIRTTVQKMSFKEASAYAQMIVELYAELLRGGERVEPLKIVHNEEKTPRYLIAGS